MPGGQGVMNSAQTRPTDGRSPTELAGAKKASLGVITCSPRSCWRDDHPGASVRVLLQDAAVASGVTPCAMCNSS